ncbi:MAG: hypothetical protein ACRDD7_17770 [Peptostreptococcaceae bacterium]
MSDKLIVIGFGVHREIIEELVKKYKDIPNLAEEVEKLYNIKEFDNSEKLTDALKEYVEDEVENISYKKKGKEVKNWERTKFYQR